MSEAQRRLEKTIQRFRTTAEGVPYYTVVGREEMLSLVLACFKIQSTPASHQGVHAGKGNASFPVTLPSHLISTPNGTPSQEIHSETTGFTVCDGYHRTLA